MTSRQSTDLIRQYINATEPSIEIKDIDFVDQSTATNEKGAILFVYDLYKVDTGSKSLYYIAILAPDSRTVCKADDQKLEQLFPEFHV